MPFRVSDIYFNSEQQSALGDLTLIVGGNNVGKSRVLRELADAITSQGNVRQRLIVMAERLELPSLEELQTQYGVVAEAPEYNAKFLDRGLIGSTWVHFGNEGAYRAFLDQWDANPRASFERFPNIGHALVALLDTEQRLALTRASSSSRPQGGVASFLQQIYDLPNAESLVNPDLLRLFGTKVRLDYSELSMIRLRVGVDIDSLPNDPREARTGFEKYPLLDEQGDGVRSFVTTFFAMKVLTRPLILIDEPEAFLHPPQAFALGKLCGENSSQHRQIVAATHSTDFVRGALSANRPMTLIRLTRAGSTNPIFHIAPQSVTEIATDPISSSAKVLDALFFNSAIVTESDADRAFYEAVARELKLNIDAHIVAGQGKQSLPRLLKSMSALGVTTAAIVDFDIFRNADEYAALALALNITPEIVKSTWERYQSIVESSSPQTPEGRAASLLDMVNTRIRQISENRDPNAQLRGLKRLGDGLSKRSDTMAELKQRGAFAVEASKRLELLALLDDLRDFRLFVVPVGELEQWLVHFHLSAEGEKADWIRRALSALPTYRLSDYDLLRSFMSDLVRFASGGSMHNSIEPS